MTMTTTALTAGTWTIDPIHSEVGFTVRHMMTRVRGHFENFEGTLTTGTNLTETQAHATIDLTSVNTRNQQRDDHLRSPDFFDVESNGQMTFRTLSFDGDTATGELTIKGITREVDLDVEFLGIAPGPGGETRIGFEATTTINRKDFGVDFDIPLDGSTLLVGHKVDINIIVQAVLDQTA